jgi:hypothetical protein
MIWTQIMLNYLRLAQAISNMGILTASAVGDGVTSHEGSV